MIEGSSITQYATKKFCNKKKLNAAVAGADKIENMCGLEIKRAIKSLQGRFRNMHLLISPIISAADSLQKINNHQ